MSEAIVLSFGHRQYKLYTCYLVEHDCFTAGTSIMSTDKNKVQGIVVHSTAAPNPNLKRYVQPSSSDSEFVKYYAPDNALGNNEQTYLMAELGSNVFNNSWNKPGDKTGFVHAFIGKNKAGEIAIANTLPYNFACWGVGIHGPNFNYSPNGRIQFEICEDNDEEYVKESYWAAVVYCTYLCYRLRLDPNKYATYVNNSGKETYPMTAYAANNKLSKDIKIPIICSHKESYDYGLGNGHGDPEHWWNTYPNLGLSMDKLRDDVKSLYNQENGYKLLYNGQNIKNLVNKLSIYNPNNYVKNEISSTSKSGTVVGSNVAFPIVYSKEFTYIEKYVNYTDGWQYSTKPGMKNIKLSRENQKFVYDWCNDEVIGDKITMPYTVALAMFLQESGANWTDRITGTGKANPEWADDGEPYASYGMGMAKNHPETVKECWDLYRRNFYEPDGAAREAIHILANRLRDQYKYVKEHDNIDEYTSVPYIGEDGKQHEFLIATYIYSAFMLYNGGLGYGNPFPDPAARTHPQFYSGRCSRFVFGMSQYLNKQGVIK